MAVFNPKILDASIRDVATCLSDNQKADLLIYALKSLPYDGRSRTVIENAIQSCLQVPTLSPENIAKVRILRARARLASGWPLGAQEDLQAALAAEPDNPEAKALLHQRSVAVEKLLAPQPTTKGRFSNEIWREIALWLPRRDLKTLLFVPNALSRVATQLLFRNLDLHFSGMVDSDDEVDSWHLLTPPARDQDARHAQRSADILTRVIIDPSFASLVRTLRIFAPKTDRDGSLLAFQTGMLANAFPKLINLRNVHITAGSEGHGPLLRTLQSSNPRLRGLSLRSPDGPADLGVLEFKHLHHFSYSTTDGSPSLLHSFLTQNRSLRTLSLDNPSWSFPTPVLSIRNLTHISFSGPFPAKCHTVSEILTHGRQLEFLTLTCLLDAPNLSSQFRDLRTGGSLTFLQHFSFTLTGVSRRATDRDLFPAICEFLRTRGEHLRSLSLLLPPEDTVHSQVGFDSSTWGVLPCLGGLKSLSMTYPADLAPGLAAWLIPRGVRALALDYVSPRDPVPFLNHLRPGIPPALRSIALSDFPSRGCSLSAIVEQGFPMVQLVRVGQTFWTVVRKKNVPHTKANSLVGGGATATMVEMQQWPRRQAKFHAREWLEWMGCEDAAMLTVYGAGVAEDAEFLFS